YLIGVGDNVEMLQEIDESMIQEEWLTENKHVTDQKGILDKLFNSQSKSDSSSKQSYFKQLFTKELTTLTKNRKRLMNSQKEREEDHELFHKYVFKSRSGISINICEITSSSHRFINSTEYFNFNDLFYKNHCGVVIC